MDYGVVEQGSFIKRLNRFSALVQVRGAEALCHVKNTGRLGELLLPGAVVYLKYSDAPERKTCWDLISVFVIQRKGARCLRPIDQRVPAFGQALRRAAEAGVGVFAYDCRVTEATLMIDAPVPVQL